MYRRRHASRRGFCWVIATSSRRLAEPGMVMVVTEECVVCCCRWASTGRLDHTCSR